MTSGVDRLSALQRELFEEWSPESEVVTDHSWGLVGTTVLKLMHEGVRYILKAGDANDHHLAREIRAHNEWLTPWPSIGRVARLMFANEDAKLLVAHYLLGELIQGPDYEFLPDTYRQSGELLAQFHGQLAVDDDEFESREKGKHSFGSTDRIELMRLLRHAFERQSSRGQRQQARRCQLTETGSHVSGFSTTASSTSSTLAGLTYARL